MTEFSDDDSVDVLNLSVRALNVLRACKLHTLGAVKAASDAQILAEPTCGRKSLNEIRDAIRCLGMTSVNMRNEVQTMRERIASLEGEIAGLRFALECTVKANVERT